MAIRLLVKIHPANFPTLIEGLGQARSFGSSIDLADKIYDLSVQYLAKGHSDPEPIREALLARIELLERDLHRQNQIRPLIFLIGQDPFASLMTPLDNRTIRTLMGETRLDRLLINVALIRLVKFDQKPCFVFYRPHRPTTIGWPLPYALPSGMLNLPTLIQVALEQQPILNLSWATKADMERTCDQFTRLEVRAFRNQGCRLKYVGASLQI